jgi:serine/threonine protein kinase
LNQDPERPPIESSRDSLHSRHPRIVDEIEGAIKTLRKLKEFASTDEQVVPAPGAGEESPATIAMTQDGGQPGPGDPSAGTQTIAATQAEPPPRNEEVPLLQTSAAFGRYQIVRMLGRGAMGAVYLAYDTELQRHVAIKTPSLGKSTQTIDRFYREARSAAQLRSPYLCPIYDVGRVGEIYYLSMAFIDGVPLSKAITQRKIKTVDEVVTIVGKVARGLQKAHEAGIVHRDLKPDNIMIDLDGEPIVLDFGLARRMDNESQVTLAGVIVGTPAFMSPEQVDGDPAKVGPATDIYSLGIVLYQLLTGELPFKGTLTSILNQIGTRPPKKPSALNRSIREDSPLERICLKMVAKAPCDRFASMAEAAAALESVSGKGDEAQVPHPSKPSRLRSWSTGLLSSLVRHRKPGKTSPGTSSDSVPDPESPTVAEPS